MAATARTNRYASTCADCGADIPANAGHLHKAADGWLVRCVDAEACTGRISAAQASTDDRAAQLAADPGQSGFYTATEEAVILAAGIDSPFDPRIEEVLAEAGLRPDAAGPASPRRATASPRRATASRRRSASSSRGKRSRRACVSGGDCSSTTGRNCGGYDCDANAN